MRGLATQSDVRPLVSMVTVERKSLPRSRRLLMWVESRCLSKAFGMVCMHVIVFHLIHLLVICQAFAQGCK